MQTAHHTLDFTDGIFSRMWYPYRKNYDLVMKPFLNLHFVGSEFFLKDKRSVFIWKKLSICLLPAPQQPTSGAKGK
jgi:hypothetical protein